MCGGDSCRDVIEHFRASPCLSLVPRPRLSVQRTLKDPAGTSDRQFGHPGDTRASVVLRRRSALLPSVAAGLYSLRPASKGWRIPSSAAVAMASAPQWGAENSRMPSMGLQNQSGRRRQERKGALLRKIDGRTRPHNYEPQVAFSSKEHA